MGRHSAFGRILQTAVLSGLCFMGLISEPLLAATTGSLTVMWNANTTDSDLAGYRVYISTDSGVFSLTPAQAAAVATTRVVNPPATQTLITSLDPTKVYWIAVTCFDTSANESGFSNVMSGQPRDVTSPTTSMTGPAAGATIFGTVTVSASASDDVGVVGVQFKVDGNNIGAEDTSSPFSILWDTTTVTNASHAVSAVARDAAGNMTTSTRTVTVNNPDTTPPTVSLSAPAAGALVLGTVSMTANASDNVGVAGVQFQVDGVSYGAEDTVAPYTISWNTTSLLNGLHTLTARARDAANNRTTSSAVSVTVNNPDLTPPSVAMTAPSNGATVVGVVIVSANASDNMGVAGVQFRIDGADLGSEDTLAPYALTWSTTTASNGSHTLAAVARDAAGNKTTSIAFNVTVNNSDLIPPTVSMFAPSGGATLTGTTVLSASATDNIGVIAVQFMLDGSNLGSVRLAAPYNYTWDTTTVANGLHTLAASARDAAGNETTSTSITVTLDNTQAGACGAGLDPDGDGVCAPADNCPTVYNPTQANTDGDNEGGDACDITIVSPTSGNLSCADAPPTIVWTPETYHMFRVYVGSTVSYSIKVNSGKKMLVTTSWTMPANKWSTICKSAKPFIFIKVLGKNPNSKWFEYSESTPLVVK